ncbi:hypothetical protein M408DRAFT_327418 [Serendipita vermifera MAFF 305830]|uniref:Endonuclease/exonuclease/phosphatase domain-containing protein n=1 Tax=Serendipita vermifera MAFF 305830 TaxID=933852 RepID=A0A0C2XQB5_SERVB|nr:hypothetical protein M408DRAFT_327418 [Serendipita vermifera MAFF 305830]
MRFFNAAAVPLAIRLITYNIRYANNWPVEGEVKWEDRRHLVISHLLFNTRYNSEAFIGLQEVYLNQLEDILQGLNNATEEKDWTYIGIGPNDGKKDGQFIPVVYRSGTYELLNFTNVWLSPTPDRPSKGWDAPYWNRVLTIGEFRHKKSRRRLAVMNTHLDDQGVVARQKSAEIIVDRTNALLSSGKYDAALLTGDFNSESNEEAYRTIQFSDKSPFFDVENVLGEHDPGRQGHQNTFTGFDWVPLKRIDYLFAAPKGESAWKVKGYAVLETKYEDGVASSDHRPVMADLVLN